MDLCKAVPFRVRRNTKEEQTSASWRTGRLSGSDLRAGEEPEPAALLSPW
jgi:hypothetical protein